MMRRSLGINCEVAGEVTEGLDVVIDSCNLV